MSNSNWQHYFDQKAERHGASVKASDYFDDKSFFMQREHILRWLGELQGQQILDAGCGVGAFSEPLTAANRVCGVDFSVNSLQFAAARGLETSNDDLTALHFADNSFDLVLCIGVIQLIEAYQPVIRELARVVKPGGTLLVQTLHQQSLQRRLLRLFERQKKFDRMYGMDELCRSFAACGVAEVEFLKYYHPFRFVSASRDSGGWSDYFCTSFAIKGRKRRE
ncbi:MAG: class I SAM-dependent methyltransferase [Sporomusaceae bacterium]|nr:class I SAM-dependent methyltransferase [Sporomusaceae bacterium]